MPAVLVKVILVALAAPNTGVTNVGELAPTKFVVPVEPDKPTSSIFLVAIISPFLHKYRRKPHM